MKKCIICQGELYKLFRIENMPATAQDIPTQEELYKDKGIKIQLCECKNCHLVQLDSEPVHYYKDVIRAGGYSTTMENLRNAQYQEFIALGKLTGKKIIEVGCGQGEFLSILAKYPVKAYGMEHKKELVELAIEKGLNVVQGYPKNEKDNFINAPFDAFTSFNFLEHQPNPLMYLKAIAHNLTNGGYGLITVPSFEYILEKKSFYEIIPDHIAYYTKESLSYLLEKAGFKLLKEERSNRDTLSFIVQKEESLQQQNIGIESQRRNIEKGNIKEVSDISGLLYQKEVIQKEVYEILENARLQNKRIAIWGASHQGFTLCATTGLFGKVEYIIDVAPFKQGKFAPASHIPIISPDNAVINPVDIIIIVAPGYTEEIKNTIYQKFGKKMEIYTLMSERLQKIS